MTSVRPIIAGDWHMLVQCLSPALAGLLDLLFQKTFPECDDASVLGTLLSGLMG